MFLFLVCLFPNEIGILDPWQKGYPENPATLAEAGAAYPQGILSAAQHGGSNSGVLLFVTKFSGFASFLPWSWEPKSNVWVKLGLLDFQLKWRSVSQGTQIHSPRETDTKTNLPGGCGTRFRLISWLAGWIWLFLHNYPPVWKTSLLCFGLWELFLDQFHFK